MACDLGATKLQLEGGTVLEGAGEPHHVACADLLPRGALEVPVRFAGLACDGGHITEHP